MDEIVRAVIKHLKQTMGKPGAILPDINGELAKMDTEIKYQRSKLVDVEDNLEVEKIRVNQLEDKITAMEKKK